MEETIDREEIIRVSESSTFRLFMEDIKAFIDRDDIVYYEKPQRMNRYSIIESIAETYCKTVVEFDKVLLINTLHDVLLTRKVLLHALR